MPTKAIYERFETDGSTEFDHWLVLKLGWRSIGEMRRGMPYAEWLAWWVYFAREAQQRELRRLQAGG